MLSQNPKVHCSQINTSSQMKSLQMHFPWCTTYMEDRFSLCASQHSLSSSKSRTKPVAFGATQGTNVLVMAGKGSHTQECKYLAIKLTSTKKESKVDFVKAVLESRLRMSKGKYRKTTVFSPVGKIGNCHSNIFLHLQYLQKLFTNSYSGI